MRKLSIGMRKTFVLGLIAIWALGPLSLNVLGSPTVGRRHPSLAVPTIPPPEISRTPVLSEGAPFVTNGTLFGDSIGMNRSSSSESVPLVRGRLFDFTGNGRTDWTVFPGPLTAGQPLTWRVLGNPADPAPNAAFIRVFQYGIVGDSIRPQDYRGDVKTEVTVRRSGVYYGAQFPTGTGGMVIDETRQWGLTSDVAGGEGDYDGDTKIDYTVVRVNGSALNWYILLSGTNTMRVVNYGTIPAGQTTILLNGADFTGDGRDELCFAQYNASAPFAPTTWYSGDAITGAGVQTTVFGDFQTMNAIPPADYTGDGIADLMEVKLNDNSFKLVWYMRNSATGAVTATVFGVGDPSFVDFDFPVRGDYDGDGRHDIAVWRPSTQTFYVLQSSNGAINGQQWGTTTDDVPLGGLGTF